MSNTPVGILFRNVTNAMKTCLIVPCIKVKNLEDKIPNRVLSSSYHLFTSNIVFSKILLNIMYYLLL